MIGNWKIERCAARPEELQTISNDTYMERRDIKEVEHSKEGDMDAYTDWECVSREIGISEYWMLKSIEQIETDKAIDDYTMQLIEEGLL